ncbi:MAG: dephospho-CoA kinase [Candidatus Poribacteria bacterium]|nr:dephospho-CoA kinase [Candidatus Poribacteria bacterium]
MNAPRKNPNGLIVGLTGGMACGKSTVAAIWKELGAHVISSDSTVHRLYNNSDVRREIHEAFGDAAFDENGNIDRSALGRIVFSDELKRQRLMAILHPRTLAIHIDESNAYLDAQPNGIVVIDSPLLFEAGLDRHCDVAVTVGATRETQIARAMTRAIQQGRTLSREDVERRIATQMPLSEKQSRATFVIENDGSLDELRVQAESVWIKLRRLASPV